MITTGYGIGSPWLRQAMALAGHDYDRLWHWQAMLPPVYKIAVLSVHLQSLSVAAVGAQSVVSVHPPTLYTLRQTVEVAHCAVQTHLYHPRQSMSFST